MEQVLRHNKGSLRFEQVAHSIDKRTITTDHVGDGSTAMTTFPMYFGLGKSQRELDFVDGGLNRDIALFLDPFVGSV